MPMSKLLPTLMLSVLALALTACAASIPLVSTTKPLLDKAPTVAKCEHPQVLPERELTQADVEHYWGKDRANLRLCAKERKLIENYYETRDSLVAK